MPVRRSPASRAKLSHCRTSSLVGRFNEPTRRRPCEWRVLVRRHVTAFARTAACEGLAHRRPGPLIAERHAANHRRPVRRAVAYIDRIFKGASAASLPVERPTRFELVVNLKAAKAIGVTIPQPLMLQADEVIA